MLTSEQANVIADEALAQQRRELHEAKNRRARPVSWFYQVPGLIKYEPFERAEMFDEAARRVGKNPIFWSIFVAWISLLGLTWYWTASKPAFSLIFSVSAPLGVLIVRIPFVRAQLSALVGSANLKRSDPSLAGGKEVDA